MTSAPSTSPAARRFISRLLILDAIFLPVCIAAFVAYRFEHIGWMLWVGVIAAICMGTGVFWLSRDVTRSQRQ